MSDQRNRLLFCSYHSYFDPSSGAAISARDLLELLVQDGWDCRVLCGGHLDFEERPQLDQLLAEHGIAFERQAGPSHTLYEFAQRGVPVRLFETPTAASKQLPTREEGSIFLAMLDETIRDFRPQVMLTYGGHWLAREVIRLAKSRGIRVVFWLRNLAYKERAPFKQVDSIIVPSRFAQTHYQEKLGLESTVIAGPINVDRVKCDVVEGKYVTFVNPSPEKGVYLFARIVHDMWQLRPDILFLVVEGRAKANWIARTGLDFRGVKNLSVMANTPDPRDFYKVSKLVLMPSLCYESFGRVAAEAKINGIPVIGHRRGGLVEELQEAGCLLDVPPSIEAQPRVVPSSDEAKPWVEAIIRLWDRDRCLQRSKGGGQKM